MNDLPIQGRLIEPKPAILDQSNIRTDRQLNVNAMDNPKEKFTIKKSQYIRNRKSSMEATQIRKEISKNVQSKTEQMK